MEIVKYKASEVLQHIRHDMRQLPPGKSYGNTSVDISLSANNYSLIDRGKTAEQVNKYRKKFEAEIFKYNRSNLVHAIEVVIQCPSDCPEEQKEQFFQESYNYICSTLPAGERCVFLATVHRDEKYYTPDGEMISKEHLHLMYVPAVPDEKHPEYQYKLCANALTRKANLRALHPGLQKHLDKAGVRATVCGEPKNGMVMALSAKQLKEITRLTGLTIDRTMTVEEFAQILAKNREYESKIDHLMNQLSVKQRLVEAVNKELLMMDMQKEKLQEEIRVKDIRIGELEATVVKKEKELEVNRGIDKGWGNTDSWGRSDNKNYERTKDITW